MKKVKNVSSYLTIPYASIFATKYGMLVRCAFFVMVPTVAYVGTVRFKNRTEIRYAGIVQFKVRGTQYAKFERFVIMWPKFF